MIGHFTPALYPKPGRLVPSRSFMIGSLSYIEPMPDPYSALIEPFRKDSPDDSAITFTHVDLHRSNILMTCSKPYHVLAIVDWEQSGWLAAYWKVRKAQ
jgi:hypothetical protein